MTFKIENDIQYRTMTLDRALADEEARTVPASLSSETVVQRTFGDEVLSHDPAHIDLSRAQGGLPLLFSHDHETFLGRVQNVRVDDGTLRGVLHFSDNSRATEVWNDVKSGMLRDMSIGYRINKAEETDTGYRAVDWSLLEASVVAVPADTNVGINRSEDTQMTDTTETPAGGTPPQGDSVVADFMEHQKRAVDLGESKGIKAERKRVADIQSVFSLHQGDDIRGLEATCIDKGLTVEQAQRSLLNLLGGQAAPIADAGFVQNGQRTDVQMGESEHEKVVRGMSDALMVRAGLASDEVKAEVRNNEYTGMTLSEMAREWCRTHNINTRGLDKMGVVGAAFKRDVTETAFTSVVADFPALLADVANKSLLRGYAEAPETWRGFCSVGAVNDFKVNSRPNMSMFPDLEVVAENGAFPIKEVTDWAESIQAQTVGARFSITRQALVNDDLASFTRIPMYMGRAAARSVGDAAYSVLLTVQTMGEDSNPLFDAANHGNVQTAGAPSVSTVDQIRVAMATQTDPSGATLNIRPSKMVVPLSYEGTAATLRNAQFDPDTGDSAGNTAGNRPNWVAGTFEVIADARIDADSNATNWFMLADPAQFDGIEVAFLNGVETPYLEQRDGFTIDGTEYKVRLDYGVAALDWRTIQLNGTAPA
jgi:HK97 family phage prohead protease